jgi:hypothetical protein
MRAVFATWCRWALLAAGLLGFPVAFATTYSLPAAIGTGVFSGCSFFTGTTYQCVGSIDFNNDNSVVLNVASNMTLQMGGSFTAKNNLQINKATGVLNLVVGGSVDIGNNMTSTFNITAGGTVNLGNNTAMTGNITAGGAINIGTGSVNGVCSPSNPACTGGSGSAPTVSTVAASGVTSSGATLNGTVSSNGSSTTVTFNYGPTVSYGSTVTASQSPLASGAGAASVSYALTGLTCGTTYHFRVVGANSAGTSNGGDLSFTTSACPTAFSAYEASVSNAAAATAANRVIQTRVAGNNGSLCKSDGTICGLTVAAFSSGAVATTYAGTVSVSLEYCGNVSRSGNTVTCGGAWVALASVATQSVPMASGVGSVTFPFANNVYEVVRVKIVSTTPNLTSYADDYFAIRPASFTVTATDNSASTAGPGRSLTSGANFHRAMRPFTLTAQALVAGGAVASNYPGSGSGPVAQTVATTAPSGGVNGVVTPGAWSANAGTVTSSTATYTEVGVIDLTLQDQTYADIDKADGSSATDRYVSATVASVGRFIPDHFAISGATLTAACPVVSPFSYFGQDGITTQFTLTAQNAASATTQNYFGALAKLNLAVYAGFGFTATPLPSGSSLSSSATAPSGAWPAPGAGSPLGVAVVTAKHQISRPTSLTGKTGISLYAAPTDGEVPAAAATQLGNAATELRWGRLVMLNVFGSDLLDLAVPVVAQYYTGTAFATNTLDSCTTLAAANVNLVNYQGGLTAANMGLSHVVSAGTLVAGKRSVVLSKPSPAISAMGNVDVLLNLGAATTATCPTATPTPSPLGSSTSAALAHLSTNNCAPYSNQSATYDRNPFARATFGTYKSPVIFQRENY